MSFFYILFNQTDKQLVFFKLYSIPDQLFFLVLIHYTGHGFLHRTQYTVQLRKVFVINSHCVLFLSVPCAPGNISTDLSCSTNDLTVSWISSSAYLQYSVTAVPLTGNVTSVICHTDGASCVLSGLQCGQTFNVSVEVSSGSCKGPHSPPQTVQTGNNDGYCKSIISSIC